MMITCFIKHPMTTTVFTTCYLLPSLLILLYEMLVMACYYIILSQSFINGHLLTECYSEIVTSLSLTVLIIVFFCSIVVLVLLHCLFHVFVVLFLFLYFSIIISRVCRDCLLHNKMKKRKNFVILPHFSP